MIKKITLALIFAIFSLFTFAENVPENTAELVASNYMISIKKDFNNSIIESITIEYQNYDVIYAFNFEKGGYILISADNKAYPILNYSFDGTFYNDDTKMPEAYKYWINAYKEQIVYIKNNNIRAYAKTITAWDTYSSGQTTNNKSLTEVLIPLFGPDGDANSIRWDQFPYYNDLCPEDAGNSTGHCPVGCVATAMSQIMYYHKFPSSGTGNHSYNSAYGLESADFENATYDWSSMPVKVSSTNMEVAELCYHAGVSVNMGYATESSGTQTSYVDDAFKNYFKYNAEFLLRDALNDDTQWKNIMKQNLDNSNPLLYSGNDGGSVGHAFVCDGYNNNDEFHFNFGWNGSMNGWFTIDNLAPGSGLDFSQSQKLVYNIAPKPLYADFTSNEINIEAGNTVQYTDISFDGDSTIVAWNWTFPGGTPSTSTAQNPSVTYNTIGHYDAILTITNVNGTSSTETKSDYIYVRATGTPDCDDLYLDYFIGFEDDEDLSTLVIEDVDNDNTTWDIRDDANNSNSGSKLIRALYAYSGNPNDKDDWFYVKCLNLTAGSTYQLSFWYKAHASYYTEKLEVKYGTASTHTDMTNTIVDLPSFSNVDYVQSVQEFTPTQSGTYYVGFHAYSDNADDYYIYIDDINLSKISSSNNPIADFTASPLSITEGNSVNFTDASDGTGNTITSWSWTFGDGGTSTTQNPSHTYTTAGNYTVSLTVTNSEGNDTKTRTNYITVSSTNPPIADFLANQTNISENGSVTFTDLSTNTPTSWEWNFGDGTSTSSQQNPTHTYTTAGTYDVSLTATNTYGSNNETKTGYITVSAGTLNPPIADFTANQTNISENENVTFTDLSTNTPTSWSWDFGDGGTSASQNPSYTYTTAGTYTVSLTATNTDGSDTEIKTDFITVNTSSSTYCTSSGSTNYATSITLVNLNTINNSTGQTNAYEDYTSISTDLSLGNTYDLSVNVNTDGSYTISGMVWIDWNHDFDFDDAGEEYNMGDAYNVSDGATSNSPLAITVPSSANIGTTRMRVSAKYISASTACQEGFDGEVEDYTINITNSTTITPPSVITYSATNVAQTTATLNGRISSNGGATITESGFVYSTSNNPIIGGTNVTQIQTSPTVTIGDFNENLTNLVAGTSYYYKAYAINSEGTAYGFEQSFTPDYQAGNHSIFISKNIPTTVNVNEVFNISISFENTGNTTWESSSDYNLGSQAPQDNTTWGDNRISLPYSVAPGEQITISANVTAPSTAGIYDFQWQMVQDGVAWFGEFSDLAQIDVSQVANISELNNEEISIYPNPANDILHININYKTAKLILYNNLGELVFKKNISENDNTINISNQASGLYIVKIVSENNIFTKSLIINK